MECKRERIHSISLVAMIVISGLTLIINNPINIIPSKLTIMGTQSNETISILPDERIELNEFLVVSSYCDWSPDGGSIVFSSYNRIIIWDTEKKDFVLEKEYPEMRFNQVSWSPDGKKILAGSMDKIGIIISKDTGKIIKQLKGHSEWIRTVDWSPDGKKVCTGSGDGEIKIWSVSSGKCLLTLDEHEDRIWDLDWSPDGDRIVSGSRDGTAIVWDITSGSILYRSQVQSRDIGSVTWHPKNNVFYTGSADGELKSWTYTNNEYVSNKIEPEKTELMAISAIEISSDGNAVAVANGYMARIQKVDVIDINQGKTIQVINGTSYSILEVDWSPGMDSLIITSDFSNPQIWNAKEWVLEETLGYFKKTVMRIDNEKNEVIFGSNGDIIYIWNFEENIMKNVKLPIYAIDHDVDDHKVCFSPDGRYVCFIAQDMSVYILDLTIKELVTKIEADCIGVSWSPNDEVLCFWNQSKLSTYNVHSDLILNRINYTQPMKKIEWAPDGKWICTIPRYSEDLSVVFDIETGENNTLIGYSGIPYDLSISGDGKYISILWSNWIGYSLNGVTTWETDNFSVVSNISVEWTLGMIYESIEWAPYNDLIFINAWKDNGIRLCDPFTGEVFLNLSRNIFTMAPIKKVQLSEDGKILVAYNARDISVWSFGDSDGDGIPNYNEHNNKTWDPLNPGYDDEEEGKEKNFSFWFGAGLTFTIISFLAIVTVVNIIRRRMKSNAKQK